jgi:hypothetical protein
MTLRFRKRIKIIPGIWLNLSKSGVSTSIGRKGLTVNLKGSKTKTTASIPGTGISYSETSSNAQTTRSGISTWVLFLLIIALTLWLIK